MYPLVLNKVLLIEKQAVLWSTHSRSWRTEPLYQSLSNFWCRKQCWMAEGVGGVQSPSLHPTCYSQSRMRPKKAHFNSFSDDSEFRVTTCSGLPGTEEFPGCRTFSLRLMNKDGWLLRFQCTWSRFALSKILQQVWHASRCLAQFRSNKEDSVGTVLELAILRRQTLGHLLNIFR